MLWVFATLLLAAAFAPWLYQGGKWLAEMAKTRELPGALEWLGAACSRAEFDRYFSRSLVTSALVLLPFLIRRIRVISGGVMVLEKTTRMPARVAIAQVVLGCVIAGSILWTAGMLLEARGAFVPKQNIPTIGKFLTKTLVPAAAASLLEEWLFRGLLLGLWLKFSRPFAACLGTSLFFAFIHFLKPPLGTALPDPASPFAGFELLSKILLHFTEPQFFIADFATLCVVGMILAWARLRTKALWFSIGLHAGWIIAFKGFILLHRPVLDHAFNPWGVGQTLRSGIFPLLALGLTAFVCHLLFKRFEPQCMLATHDRDDGDLLKTRST